MVLGPKESWDLFNLVTFGLAGFVAAAFKYLLGRHNKLEDGVALDYKKLSQEIESVRSEQRESSATRDQRLITLEVNQQVMSKDIDKLDRKLEKTLEHINRNIKGVHNLVMDHFKDEK